MEADIYTESEEKKMMLALSVQGLRILRINVTCN